MKISHLSTLLAITVRSANTASARELLSDKEVQTNWDHPFGEKQSPGHDLGNEKKQLIEYSDRDINLSASAFRTQEHDLSVIKDVTIMQHSFVDTGRRLSDRFELVGDALPSSANQFDQTGFALAINAVGDMLIVGAPNANSGVGKVIIYSHSSGTGWTEQTTIDGVSESYFGVSVDMNDDGDRVVIGGNFENSNTATAGFVGVYIYDSIGSSWTLLGNISRSVPGDRFGVSVAMNAAGDRIVVGADGDSNSKGVVQVHYTPSPFTEWDQLGEDIEGILDGDQHGSSVDINAAGDAVIVGAPKSSGAFEAGAVRVFEFSSSSWSVKGEIITGTSSSDNLGTSVAINGAGDRIIAGAAMYSSKTGLARVYEFSQDDSKWLKMGSDIVGAAENDQFGTAVSMDDLGSRVFIGAPLVSSPANGYVSVYDYRSNEWALTDQIVVSGVNVGRSVDANAVGDYFAVGSDVYDTYRGYAAVFFDTEYSEAPSFEPSFSPSVSMVPSALPSDEPSLLPSDGPSTVPSLSSSPSQQPSDLPSAMPSDEPSRMPSAMPSDAPSMLPSDKPSELPSTFPSDKPSMRPSSKPSRLPSTLPSVLPSRSPSGQPSMLPSGEPSLFPSISLQPSRSNQPSPNPSYSPSSMPSTTVGPSLMPSISAMPSMSPSIVPSLNPSDLPSDLPSLSRAPSVSPSYMPSVHPSDIPTSSPSESGSPSEVPSMAPTGRDFCYDDGSFLYQGQNEQDCNWVAEASPSRCKKWDINNGYGFENCRKTCDKCAYLDDPNWVGVKKFHTCKYVSKKKAVKRCKKVPGAKEACIKTCEQPSCRNNIDFLYKNRQGRDCKWVKKNAERLCLKNSIAINCPIACSLCNYADYKSFPKQSFESHMKSVEQTENVISGGNADDDIEVRDGYRSKTEYGDDANAVHVGVDSGTISEKKTWSSNIFLRSVDGNKPGTSDIE